MAQQPIILTDQIMAIFAQTLKKVKIAVRRKELTA